MSTPRHLSWVDIIRMGAVQMCLGAIVVLMTSTLNRLMVVELALPAVLPGALVALHYGVQITRPSWGFLSDTTGGRTFWIIAGMTALATGAMLAAGAVWWMETAFWPALMLSVVAYALIGLGVGASGTALLALLATATAPRRRPAAATITWLMMILGIAVTAGFVGSLLDPYSATRMLAVVATVCIATVFLSSIAIWGIERHVTCAPQPESQPFLRGLTEVWAEPSARRFTVFVFLSMTAYFMQELILEPYAGLVFDFTPGQSTSLSGAQNGGVFLGMVLVGIAGTALRLGSLRMWVVAGCLGSAASLTIISIIGSIGPGAPLVPAVVSLGFFNGMFAVAAIGSMMAKAGEGRGQREGTRMGLWGAAQAIAAGFGGLLGAASVDILRHSMTDAPAFGTVFLAEASLFLVAAAHAARLMSSAPASQPDAALVPGE